MDEQPLPTESNLSTSVTDALVTYIRQRELQGIATYGTSLMTFNGRDAVRDALEEALDLAQYLMQIQLERDAMVERIADQQGTIQTLRKKEAVMALSPSAANPLGLEALERGLRSYLGPSIWQKHFTPRPEATHEA